MQHGLSDGYRGDDVIVVIERREKIQVNQHLLALRHSDTGFGRKNHYRLR